jgi:hypothetical protein
LAQAAEGIERLLYLDRRWMEMRDRVVRLGIIAALLAGVMCVAVAAQTAGKVPPPPAPPAAPAASAATKSESVSGDVIVEKGQTVSDATAVNGSVIVYGHVTGDATAVKGDVHVKPGGVIDGKAEAVGGKVIKDPGGQIRGQVSSIGGGKPHKGGSTNVQGSIVVVKGETVDEATAVQGDITVYGRVAGDATAVAGKLDVRPGGVVDGDATSVMGDLYVRPGGTVKGDATAVMGTVVQEIGGTISGQKTSVGFPVPKWLAGHMVGLGGTGGIVVLLILATASLVFWALVTMIVVAIWPDRMQAVATCTVTRPGWSVLYGVVGMLTILPLMIVLAITCVGIPLILVEIVLVVALLLVGAVGVKLALGQMIGKGIGRPFRSLIWPAVLGSVILSLIRFPVVSMAGQFICGILFTFGFGAAIMTGFGTSPDWFPRRFSRQRPAAPVVGPAPAPPTAPPAQEGGPEAPASG